MKPGLPENEALRLSTLQSLNILHTPPQARFVNLCALAADVFDVPIAAISLINKDQQWFMASVGLDLKGTTRDVSFCGHVVEAGAPFTCLDALQHPWFCENPMVLSGPFVRFYSGCPIIVPGTDHCLGALCLVDTEPKSVFDEKKVAMLLSFAVQAAELLRLEVQVQQVQTEQQVFLARISHDLRTPLNGIMGHATLLSDATCPHMPTQLPGAVSSFLSCGSHQTQTDEVRESANTILECATHMLHLVNGILEFTNVSSGRDMKLVTQWFSLRSCLEAIFRMYEGDSHLAATGLTIGYQMAKPDLMVETDPERMKQIIINLIGNGLKFTKKGHVTLIVHDRDDSDDSDGEDRWKLKFEVRDTGRGVDPEIASTIFKPFVKSHASVNHTGSGLGLANCHMLCEAMGGSIWFESASQGTSFFFDIDVQTKPANPPGMLFHGKSVLIVSRDTTILRLVQGHCESLRIRTTLARQLSSKREEHYDALLCSANQLPDFVLRVPVIQLPATGCQQQKVEENETGTTGGPSVSVGPVLRQGSLQRILQTLWDDPAHTHRVPSPDRVVSFIDLYALVVDDNRVNQRVLSGLLRRLGVKVAVAENGLEAVKMAASTKYDVVFMDIDMPVMDGLAATKHLRRMVDCPYIIECSANICSSGASSLMDAFLPKPTLLENLRGVLEKYAAQATTGSSLGRPGPVAVPCAAPSVSWTSRPTNDSHTHQQQAGTRSCLRIPCPRLWCGKRTQL